MSPLHLSAAFLAFASLITIVVFNDTDAERDEGLSKKAEVNHAILQGADPTDMLAPTASGKALKGSCVSGLIAGDIDSNEYSKVAYASINQGDVKYIQISRYMPVYLEQKSYQTVSATEITTLPPEIKQALHQGISHPEECAKETLYLSSVHAISSSESRY